MHIRRPLVLVFVLFSLLICLCKALDAPIFGKAHLSEEIQEEISRSIPLTITGTIDDRQVHPRSTIYILKDASILREHTGIHAEEHRIPLHRILLIQRRTPERSGEQGKRKSKENSVQDGDASSRKELPIGTIIEAKGKLEGIPSPDNPGAFNQKNYYAEKRIFYSAFADSVSVRKSKTSWKEQMLQFRKTAESHLQRMMPEKEAGILSAMLFGDKELLDEETETNYRLSGISHVLAISGLHIGGIAWILYRLLALIGFSNTLCIPFSCIGAGLYCRIAGAPLSALRAVWMFAVLMGAKASKRTYDSLSALSLAGIVLLLTNPGSLFSCGFQLSFSAVLGIAYFYPLLLSVLPVDFWKRGSPQKKRVQGILKSFFLWLSISFTTLPLTAFYFYEIPLFSFLPNLLILPCMSLLLFLGLGGCLAGILFIPFGKILLAPAVLLLKGFDLLSWMIRNIPHSTVIVGQPSLFNLLLYYFLLFLAGWMLSTRPVLRSMKRCRSIWKNLFYRSRERNYRKEKKGMEIQQKEGEDKLFWIPLGIILAAFLLLFIRPIPPFSLSALSVGQGDCLIWQDGSGGAWMMDGGSTSQKQIGKYVILPYLKQQGIRKMNGIFISHDDQDHCNGILELLEAVGKKETVLEIRKLFLPLWMKGTEMEGKYRKAAALSGTRMLFLKKGDEIRTKKISMRILHPENSTIRGDEGNAGSMVLHLSYRDFDALLTGDLEGEGEKEILPEVSVIDCLKVAHHGSRNSTSMEFLKATHPKVCLISAPTRSIYGHPHRETLDRIREIKAAVFNTSESGRILLQVKKRDLIVQTYRKPPS